jgi:DNA replication protein DnaC
MRGKLTHATANYKVGSENNVEKTIEFIGERYDSRVYDRIFEMFNIVIFSGKSMRR